MDPSHVPSYTHVEIERQALAVLAQAYPKGLTIPIDIDLVVETQSIFGDIIPDELLEDRFGVAAVLVNRGEVVDILIDEDTYVEQQSRARFSIAHELGHIVLHEKLWQGCTTLEASLEMQKRIGRVYDHIEMAANFFAGAILIPRNQLFQDISKLYTGLIGLWGFDNSDLIIQKVQSNLARVYKVSIQSMQIRLRQLKIDKMVKEALGYKSPYLQI